MYFPSKRKNERTKKAQKKTNETDGKRVVFQTIAKTEGGCLLLFFSARLNTTILRQSVYATFRYYIMHESAFSTSPRQMARKYCRRNVNGATNSRRLRNDILTMTETNEAARPSPPLASTNKRIHTFYRIYSALDIDIGEALLLASAQNVSNYRHQFLFETYPFYCIFVFFPSLWPYLAVCSLFHLLKCLAIGCCCCCCQNDCSYTQTVYANFSFP